MTKTCIRCGETKPLDGFLPNRATKAGFYGKCRVCRAEEARERYWADPQERERQKARVRRNRNLRHAATMGPTSSVGLEVVSVDNGET